MQVLAGFLKEVILKLTSEEWASARSRPESFPSGGGDRKEVWGGGRPGYGVGGGAEWGMPYLPTSWYAGGSSCKPFVAERGAQACTATTCLPADSSVLGQ